MNVAGVLKAIHHVPVGQVEIEFRAGVFRKKNFTPGVAPAVFDAIHTRLTQKMEYTCEQTTDTIYGGYRMREGGAIMQKVKLLSQDFYPREESPVEGVRLSVASEVDVPPIDHFMPSTKHKFQRHKDRTSFNVPGGAWRIDLTRVLSLQDKDEDRYTYEVEVELADHSRLLIVPMPVLLAEGMEVLRGALTV
jgi:hypothetical protein